MTKKGEYWSVVKMTDNSRVSIYYDEPKSIDEERKMAEEKSGKKAKKVDQTYRWDSVMEAYV